MDYDITLLRTRVKAVVIANGKRKVMEGKLRCANETLLLFVGEDVYRVVEIIQKVKE